ncbi:MAG: radical SAM protein, partial [Candidatus Hydrogenedens sp.]
KIIKEREMESVVFGGGEPLQWKFPLSHSINLAKMMGLHTQIGTNGIGLTPEVIGNLNADRYVLPLDSNNPLVHNYLRKGFRKHYDIIKNRLKYLTERKIPFTISTVVCKINLDILNEITAFLLHLWEKGAKIHAWHLYRFLPFGRNGFRNADMLNISKNEYFDKTEEIKKNDLPFLVYRRPNMQLSKEVDFFWVEEGHVKIGSQIWQEKYSFYCSCK